MKNLRILFNGLIKENPTFVLLLGMCPTLGTTSSAYLFQFHYLMHQEVDTRHGAYPLVYRGHSIIGNHSSDAYQGLCS